MPASLLAIDGPFGRFADRLLAVELPELPVARRADTVAFVCRRAAQVPSPLRVGVLALSIAVAQALHAPVALLGASLAAPVSLACWALFAVHLVWQARRVRVEDPALALALFKSNRTAGLLLFAACAFLSHPHL